MARLDSSREFVVAQERARLKLAEKRFEEMKKQYGIIHVPGQSNTTTTSTTGFGCTSVHRSKADAIKMERETRNHDVQGRWNRVQMNGKLKKQLRNHTRAFR
jgi:hypothetical protein